MLNTVDRKQRELPQRLDCEVILNHSHRLFARQLCSHFEPIQMFASWFTWAQIAAATQLTTVLKKY